MLEQLASDVFNWLVVTYDSIIPVSGDTALAFSLRVLMLKLVAFSTMAAVGAVILRLLFWLIGFGFEYLYSKTIHWWVNRKENSGSKVFKYRPFDFFETLGRFLKAEGLGVYTFIGLDAQRSNKYYVVISDQDRMKHLQVIGMTGTGKTTGVFLPLFYQDALKNRPVIFIDPKGEWETLSFLDQISNEVGRPEDFYYFSLSHPKISSTYNPLLAGDCDVDVIIDAFLSNFDNDNTYYRDVAKTLFRHGYKVLHSLQKPFTVMDMYAYLNNEECFNDVNKQAKTQKQAHKHLLLMDGEIRKLNAQHKNWRVCLIGFNNYLLMFDHELFNDADSDIILSDCVRDKKMVCFQLPTNAYPLLAPKIGRMVQANLRYISSLIQTRQLAVGGPVSVIIDEYGSFADETFVEVLNKARSSGMMVTLGHQSLSDLTAVSESFMHRIYENTLTKLIFKQSDPILCEQESRSTGTVKKAGRTYRETKGQFGNTMLTGEASVRFENEFILHPDKIKNLQPYGQGYLISRTNNQIECVNVSPLGFKVGSGFTGNFKLKKRDGLDLYRKYYEYVPIGGLKAKDDLKKDEWFD